MAKKIDHEQVKGVAKLARLELSDKQVGEFSEQLSVSGLKNKNQVQIPDTNKPGFHRRSHLYL